MVQCRHGHLARLLHLLCPGRSSAYPGEQAPIPGCVVFTMYFHGALNRGQLLPLRIATMAFHG